MKGERQVMSEVVIIRTKDGEPMDIPPEYLSEIYDYSLVYYRTLLRSIIRNKKGGDDFLLDKFFGMKRKLQNIRHALNGKYNIIVVVDFVSSEQKQAKTKNNNQSS